MILAVMIIWIKSPVSCTWVVGPMPGASLLKSLRSAKSIAASESTPKALLIKL
jgi:hypothetical protein